AQGDRGPVQGDRLGGPVVLLVLVAPDDVVALVEVRGAGVVELGVLDFEHVVGRRMPRAAMPPDAVRLPAREVRAGASPDAGERIHLFPRAKVVAVRVVAGAVGI